MADVRYYEGGVSSVYMWDLDDGIAGVVLFKKSTVPFKLRVADLQHRLELDGIAYTYLKQWIILEAHRTNLRAPLCST